MLVRISPRAPCRHVLFPPERREFSPDAGFLKQTKISVTIRCWPALDSPEANSAGITAAFPPAAFPFIIIFPYFLVPCKNCAEPSARLKENRCIVLPASPQQRLASPKTAKRPACRTQGGIGRKKCWTRQGSIILCFSLYPRQTFLGKSLGCGPIFPICFPGFSSLRDKKAGKEDLFPAFL